MTEVFGFLLTTVDFVVPAAAVWFLVLRRKNEGLLSSALAAAGMSVFLVPTLMFLLNRIFAYPLDRVSLTGLAATLVAGAVAWHWLIAPRMTRFWHQVTRFGQVIGGVERPDPEEESDRLSTNPEAATNDATLK